MSTMARRSSPPANGAKPAAKARRKRQKDPSLADLKRQVLGLAKVSGTRELKRTNVDLSHLDFRLKASWRSALEVLQQAEEAMADWDSNPSEEYKTLFAEIDQAAAAYSASIERGFKLSDQLLRAADDLEAFAGELQTEAEELKAIEQVSRRQRRVRSLN
ncbi:MAG: hypothetical protein ER33_07255 [Cyanobium sp. CACIAM 14]|nr:MAG: hypothetical protein ER33_07255 [Cyanobium sp. CACIAM 14]